MAAHNSQFYNTDTGAQPTPSSIAPRASTDRWIDPNIDTKREAQAYQARITRLAAEAADVTKTPQSRDIAKREHDSLVRALPFQIAGWAEIDRRRGGK